MPKPGFRRTVDEGLGGHRLLEDTVRILPSDAPCGADPKTHGIEITRGRVPCAMFPLVILTGNGEREFPPAFLRRCLSWT